MPPRTHAFQLSDIHHDKNVRGSKSGDWNVVQGYCQACLTATVPHSNLPLLHWHHHPGPWNEQQDCMGSVLTPYCPVYGSSQGPCWSQPGSCNPRQIALQPPSRLSAAAAEHGCHFKLVDHHSQQSWVEADALQFIESPAWTQRGWNLLR